MPWNVDNNLSSLISWNGESSCKYLYLSLKKRWIFDSLRFTCKMVSFLIKKDVFKP